MAESGEGTPAPAETPKTPLTPVVENPLPDPDIQHSLEILERRILDSNRTNELDKPPEQ